MIGAFTESIVEDAAFAWMEGVGYVVAHGPDLAPEQPTGELADFGQVVLEGRRRRAPARLKLGVLLRPWTINLGGT